MSTRSFELERTGITQTAWLEQLFGLVVLAWVAYLRIGVWLAGQRDIKVKAHYREALSLVRLGTETQKGLLR